MNKYLVATRLFYKIIEAKSASDAFVEVNTEKFDLTDPAIFWDKEALREHLIANNSVILERTHLSRVFLIV